METENKNLLREGVTAFGIHLDEKAVEAFDLYLKELLKWNQKINLTGIRTEKGIILKHFIDSLSIRPYLPNVSSLLDIGSGAGFPGIPIKMLQPSLEVTLIDSILKKVHFQKHIIRMLGLKRIEPIHGRVQDKKILQRMEGRYDLIISRAFSNLQTLLILGFPLLKKGGILLAMMGEVGNEEIQRLSETEGIQYQLQKIVPFLLPFSSFKRTIILFEKQ